MSEFGVGQWAWGPDSDWGSYHAGTHRVPDGSCGACPTCRPAAQEEIDAAPIMKGDWITSDLFERTVKARHDGPYKAYHHATAEDYRRAKRNVAREAIAMHEEVER